MGAAIALLGRLTDIAGSFHIAVTKRSGAIDESDRERCIRLADQIAILNKDLVLKQIALAPSSTCCCQRLMDSIRSSASRTAAASA